MSTIRKRQRGELTPCSRLRKQIRDSEWCVNEAKSALFDLISDVRAKLDSDESLRREYDALVKEMVLLGGPGGKKRVHL